VDRVTPWAIGERLPWWQCRSGNARRSHRFPARFHRAGGGSPQPEIEMRPRVPIGSRRFCRSGGSVRGGASRSLGRATGQAVCGRAPGGTPSGEPPLLRSLGHLWARLSNLRIGSCQKEGPLRMARKRLQVAADCISDALRAKRNAARCVFARATSWDSALVRIRRLPH